MLGPAERHLGESEPVMVDLSACATVPISSPVAGCATGRRQPSSNCRRRFRNIYRDIAYQSRRITSKAIEMRVWVETNGIVL
jgi:hypothetical protein